MPTIIENRRNLHQIPEIELTTQKTAQYIENVLDLYDCTIDHPIQNSVTAYFDNKKEKTIVFRSDMDALPMEENTGLEFKSTNGCMHACGHDGHMAMVLELAKYAKESDYCYFSQAKKNLVAPNLSLNLNSSINLMLPPSMEHTSIQNLKKAKFIHVLMK
jgi:metal-dependent amidase/aminoacylase/carboxypeptidase family protein